MGRAGRVAAAAADGAVRPAGRRARRAPGRRGARRRRAGQPAGRRSGRGCGSSGRPTARRRTRGRTRRSCATWPRSAGPSRRLRCAGSVPGEAPRVRLELPDGGLADAADDLARRVRLRRAPRRPGARPVVAATATRTTRRCGAAARSVSRQVLEYPVWAWHWATPGDRPGAVGAGGAGRPRRPDPAGEGRGGGAASAARSPRSAPGPRTARCSRPASSRTSTGTTRCCCGDACARTTSTRSTRGRTTRGTCAAGGTSGASGPRSCAALPQERYRRGFEPGCAVGALTVGLAERCDQLLAVDRHERPVAAATEAVAGLEHVRVGRMDVPAQWPDGSFDLVVLSEIGYYFAGEDLARLADLAVASLRPGGTLLGVPLAAPRTGPRRPGRRGAPGRWRRSRSCCRSYVTRRRTSSSTSGPAAPSASPARAEGLA